MKLNTKKTGAFQIVAGLPNNLFFYLKKDQQ